MGQSTSSTENKEMESSTETKDKKSSTPSFAEALQNRAVVAQVSLESRLEEMLDKELSPEIVAAHVEARVTDILKRVIDAADQGHRHILGTVHSTLFKTVWQKAKYYTNFDKCTYYRRFNEYEKAFRDEFAKRTQIIAVADLRSLKKSLKPAFYISGEDQDHQLLFNLKF